MISIWFDKTGDVIRHSLLRPQKSRFTVRFNTVIMSVVVATELEAILRAASVYVLDVDSTVCTDEGIDKLAEHCGVGQAVRDW